MIRMLLTLHNSLFCTELPEIINRQLTLEAFSRSPSMELKEWGFKKNLTSDEWEYVLHKKRK
jgi:hypothetical protein